MKKLIAGNWKMNGSLSMMDDFAISLYKNVDKNENDILLCLPYSLIGPAIQLFRSKDIFIGAQDCSKFSDSGAYTGEVSATMLRDLGCSHVILGHSERRQYISETNDVIRTKLENAINEKLHVILCVGETLIERDENKHFEKINKQLVSAMEVLSLECLSHVTLAYEPIWAIGTGKTATTNQANEMHKYIHDIISKNFGPMCADGIKILYGGSMNAENANELLSQSYIDGGLIGGASLKPVDFSKIANIKI